MRSVIEAVESGAVPDAAVRWAIRRLHARRLEEQRAACAGDPGAALDAWAAAMRRSPIAPLPEKANEQHYEVPPALFVLMLGRRLKYSACHWPEGVTTLDEAEEAMLALTCDRAQLRDGMRVLDLGCGWGSLTTWVLERYPACEVVAVSNSAPQRLFIEERLRSRGLAGRATVITRDVNDFEAPGTFDRIISVEMMEHARNWEALLARAARWIRPEGRMFVHVFSHRKLAYPFETSGQDDWMGRHFFTGGQMPAHGLMSRFQRDLVIEEDWLENGRGYQLTAEAWLSRLDARRDEALAILSRGVGREEGEVRLQRWRMFHMACAELFGWAGGTEWGVSHYRLAPRAGAGS